MLFGANFQYEGYGPKATFGHIFASQKHFWLVFNTLSKYWENDSVYRFIVLVLLLLLLFANCNLLHLLVRVSAARVRSSWSTLCSSVSSTCARSISTVTWRVCARNATTWCRRRTSTCLFTTPSWRRSSRATRRSRHAVFTPTFIACQNDRRIPLVAPLAFRPNIGFVSHRPTYYFCDFWG